MNRCPVHMDIYYKHNTRTEWAHYNGHKEGSGSFPLFAEEVPSQHQLGFLLLVFWERPCITDVSSCCMAYSLPFFLITTSKKSFVLEVFLRKTEDCKPEGEHIEINHRANGESCIKICLKLGFSF